MDLLISLVRIDDEENASLCIKIIIDVLQHQTKVLGDKLQPFLALIEHMFDQINWTTKRLITHLKCHYPIALRSTTTPLD